MNQSLTNPVKSEYRVGVEASGKLAPPQSDVFGQDIPTHQENTGK
ncbi:hypothetical protein [Algimonas porphyrae]